MSTKAQRIEKIHSLAWDLARSGEYRNWYHIELALRKRELPEARGELDNKVTRDGLDETCAYALQAKHRGLTFEQAMLVGMKLDDCCDGQPNGEGLHRAEENAH